MVQRRWIQLATIRFRVQSLASFRGLRIRRCRELWGRSQRWLGSWVAVALAQAGSWSSLIGPQPGSLHMSQAQPTKRKKGGKKEKIRGSSDWLTAKGGGCQLVKCRKVSKIFTAWANPRLTCAPPRSCALWRGLRTGGTLGGKGWPSREEFWKKEKILFIPWKQINKYIFNRNAE